MEGKAVLFKSSPIIGLVFDIELRNKPILKSSPIWSGRWNRPLARSTLRRQIKAPDCFTVERILPRANEHTGFSTMRTSNG